MLTDKRHTHTADAGMLHFMHAIKRCAQTVLIIGMYAYIPIRIFWFLCKIRRQPQNELISEVLLIYDRLVHTCTWSNTLGILNTFKFKVNLTITFFPLVLVLVIHVWTL